MNDRRERCSFFVTIFLVSLASLSTATATGETHICNVYRNNFTLFSSYSVAATQLPEPGEKANCLMFHTQYTHSAQWKFSEFMRSCLIEHPNQNANTWMCGVRWRICCRVVILFNSYQRSFLCVAHCMEHQRRPSSSLVSLAVDDKTGLHFLHISPSSVILWGVRQ